MVQYYKTIEEQVIDTTKWMSSTKLKQTLIYHQTKLTQSIENWRNQTFHQTFVDIIEDKLYCQSDADEIFSQRDDEELDWHSIQEELCNIDWYEPWPNWPKNW